MSGHAFNHNRGHERGMVDELGLPMKNFIVFVLNLPLSSHNECLVTTLQNFLGMIFLRENNFSH